MRSSFPVSPRSRMNLRWGHFGWVLDGFLILGISLSNCSLNRCCGIQQPKQVPLVSGRRSTLNCILPLLMEHLSALSGSLGGRKALSTLLGFKQSWAVLENPSLDTLCPTRSNNILLCVCVCMWEEALKQVLFWWLSTCLGHLKTAKCSRRSVFLWHCRMYNGGTALAMSMSRNLT